MKMNGEAMSTPPSSPIFRLNMNPSLGSLMSIFPAIVPGITADEIGTMMKSTIRVRNENDTTQPAMSAYKQ